ncbi:prenyltransferase/squalene oxidase repeat-containing protein [Streptomyces mayteni]
MKSAHSGLAAFQSRAAGAARTLLGSQGYDGGWGLTLTSVSSIVNTSEVLPILRAAGIAGQPVRRALDFLTVAIAEHCRPRHKGGRGEHTRFVAFGLAGLLSHSRFFHHTGVAETAAWCVSWLEDHQVDHGWPEVLGLDDTSLHQTALVVHGLAVLRDALHEFGPGLVLPGGVETSSLLERVEPLIEHGVHGLLYHRRPGGAWGWRTYVDTDPSPSKTALCLLGLSAVCSGTGPGGEPAYRDIPREAGGVHGPVQYKQLSEVVVEAGQWLLHNHHRWETFVEDDKDVQGTAWEHMAYALCTQGAVRAGANPRDPRLTKAWRLMNDLWDPEVGLWNEPGASGKRATIRAAYYTVSAYEEAVQRLSRMSLAGGTSEDVSEASAQVVIIRVALGPGRTVLVEARDSEGSVRCELSERLFDVVKAVHDAPEAALSTERIAATLCVAPSSVPKYVQRLNQAVSAAFGGAPARLLLASTVDGASGYRLAGR